MSGGALGEKNMHLMKTLDDAWNSQDWDTFSKRHTDDVVVRWTRSAALNALSTSSAVAEGISVITF